MMYAWLLLVIMIPGVDVLRCYKCTSNDGGEQCNSEQRIAACTNREHVCYSLSYSLTLHVSKNATKTRFITTKGCFDRNTSCQKACRQFSVSLSYKNCKVECCNKYLCNKEVVHVERQKRFSNGTNHTPTFSCFPLCIIISLLVSISIHLYDAG